MRRAAPGRPVVAIVARACWVLAIAVTVSACGIAAQDAPQPLSSRDVALAGATPSPTPTAAVTTPTPPPAVTEQVDVYLVRGDRLADVQRTVTLSAVPAPAIAALLAGPTPEEAAAGVRTAIPAATPSLDVTVVAGVAVVTVPPTFAQLSGPDQILAVAELVYTLTGIEGVTGMQMTDGDQIVAVPTPHGQLSPGPVSRADFAALGPP
jgi:hypothetical protein